MYAILGFLILVIAFIFAIRTPVVQTYIVSKVAEWLSSELKTVVTVEAIDIRFFNKLQINGLYVEDLHGDTLLYTQEIISNINILPFRSNKLFLEDVELENGVVRIKRYPNEENLNFNFITEYFDQGSGKKSSDPLQFDPGEVTLSNFRFDYQPVSVLEHESSFGIDFNDISLHDLNIQVSNFRIESDTTYFDVDNLSLKDKSGFKLSYFETQASISPVKMHFQGLLINTDETNIGCDLTFMYDDFNDFSDFISNVRFNAIFNQTTVSSNDLAYFAPQLQGMNRVAGIEGRVKGTVDQLKAKNISLTYGVNTLFKGDVNISGLPDLEESFIDLVAQNLMVSTTDIESFPLPPFESGKHVELPNSFASLGVVSFSGKFTGFLNDFVAFGNIKSDLGSLSSDINLKLTNDPAKNSYSGHLSAFDFNVGKLTGSENVLGRTSFNAKVEGKGMSISSANASMEGAIQYFEFRGYHYTDLQVDGTFNSQKFNGYFSVRDSNLTLDFSGLIDYTDEIPVYNFTASIQSAHLAKLNLLNRDPSSCLSLYTEIKASGDELSALTGSIVVTDFYYSELENELYVDSIHYVADKTGLSKQASIESPLFDFSINGVYYTYDLLPIIDGYLNSYLPVYKSELNSENKRSLNFNYSITLKETDDLFKIFMPQLRIENGTTIAGGYDNNEEQLYLQLKSDQISYAEADMNDVLIDSYIHDNKLYFDSWIKNIVISDTTHINNLKVLASTNKQQSDFTISAHAPDSNKTSISVTGKTNYHENNVVVLNIFDSDITLDSYKWIFDNNNVAIFDPEKVSFSNWRLHNNKESLLLDGVISPNQKDVITIGFENFQLERFNPILHIIKIHATGKADGNIKLAGLMETPGINSNLRVEELSLNYDTLGNADLNFSYDTESQIVDVKGSIDKGGEKNIKVDGIYYAGNDKDSLDFDIELDKTELHTFASYLDGVMSEVRGLARGKLRLTGTSKKPIITGSVRLQKTSFIVDYLQTRYSIADEVQLSNGKIEFNDVKVNDMYGNTAYVKGAILHDHFKDMRLDLNIKANNFQALNTTYKDNELFYGTAFTSGTIKITGPFDLVKFNMSLRTEKNTELFIPLSNPSEVTGSSFINFVSHQEENLPKKENKPENIGVEVVMDLEATNDAIVQLIFDSKIGDVMKGRGSGDLRIVIDRFANFNIQGNYVISSGDYLFTLQNVINKKFIIEDGGTISWTGSPYDAIVNLQGKYKLKASLYDLIQDTAYKSRIPVQVLLNIKEELFNPEISFDIEIPDADPFTESLVNRYINSEQELSKQTMSLLVLGRFSKADDVEFVGTSTNSVSANATELLSQQLSVWGSQISDAFDIGVNYRAGDAFSQEELEIILSTQLFNDRVTIDGNFGVAGNNASSSNSENTSDIIGDFNVEYKVSKDGRFRFKAFNRTITNTLTNSYNSPYTQGVGILYRQDFNTIGELFRKSQKQ